MQFNKARCNVYESKANPKHIVGNTKPKKGLNLRVKAIKFEEKYNSRKEVPAESLMDLQNLGNFKPFSHKSGKPKYRIYTFKREVILKLQKRTIKMIKLFVKDIKNDGLTKAYKKHNQNRGLSKKLKKLEYRDQEILNKLWKRSFKKFMGL